MKRLLRNKRAVSPVISAVIMILVATIGMTILFAFFVNYARDFQVGSGSAVLESVVIEDVWFQDSNTIQIWVYNAGKVSFNVTSVFIDDFRAEISFTDGIVKVGDHGRLFVKPLPSMSPGDELYVMKFVTARGSAVEGSFYWE